MKVFNFVPYKKENMTGSFIGVRQTSPHQLTILFPFNTFSVWKGFANVEFHNIFVMNCHFTVGAVGQQLKKIIQKLK